jgi:hypothetical protein
MCLGSLGILCAVYIFISAELGRRHPTRLVTNFMHKSGYTRSIVALWHFHGDARSARQAILTDTHIRRQYLIERYIWSLIVLLASLYWMLSYG